MADVEEPVSGAAALAALGVDLTRMAASFREEAPEELAERQRRAEERARAERRRLALAALESFPCPAAVREAIVDGRLADTAATRAVDRWIDADPGGKGKPTLVLLGGPGSGKTTAAAYAGHRCQWGARYAKMREVANLFRAGFGEDAERFERLLRAGLLIVDELSTERDVDLGRAALHEIVDERQSRGSATILIANRTKAELLERYDARTIDRLREGAVVVELADKSMRRGTW